MKMVTDIKLLRAIAERASRFYASVGVKVKPEFIMVELRVVHDEIVPLRLDDLLNADDSNFVHDVAGIHQHLDLGNCRLNDFFHPRYAATKH